MIPPRSHIRTFLTDQLGHIPIPYAWDEKEYQETPVVIVNEDEIYLAKCDKDGNPIIKEEKLPDGTVTEAKVRGQRICGALRTYHSGLRCRLPAGRRTNHVGVGRCSIHERPHNARYGDLAILENYKAKGLALSVKELAQVVPNLLNDSELSSLKTEIITTEQLYAELINQEASDIERDEYIPLTDLLRRLKETYAKIQTQKLLIDMNSINLFVGGIMDIARRVLKKAAYSELAAAIEDDLVFPVNKATQKLITMKED